MQIFSSLKDKVAFYRLLAFTIIVFLGCGICIWGWYPGIVMGDVVAQLHAAQSDYLGTWHPPIMALFWKAELWVLGYIGSLFITWILLANIALFYLLWPIVKVSFKGIVLYLVLYLSPVIFCNFGWLYKDVPLTWSVVILAGMLLSRDFAERGVLKSTLFAIIALWSILLRHNAVFLVIPLIVGYFAPKGWKFGGRSLVACLLLSLIMIKTDGFINKQILRAHDEHPEVALYIFDLAGIDRYRKSNAQVISTFNKAEIGEQKEQWKVFSPDQKMAVCYSPRWWDSLDWAAEKEMCLRLARPWLALGHNELRRRWLSEINRHPYAYLTHRLNYFVYFMGFSYKGLTHMHLMLDFIPGDYSSTPPILRDTIVASTGRSLGQLFAYTPLFYGATWLIIGIFLFVITLKSTTQGRRNINCIVLSSVLYLGAYLPIGVASDYRYIFPSIMLDITALIALTVYPKNNKSMSKSR